MRQRSRLDRQIDKLVSAVPILRGPVTFLLAPPLWPLRLTLGLLLVPMSLLAILPVFGLWMLPLGLLLLAVDLPRLQPLVNGVIIKARWRVRSWGRSIRRK